jgi:hypothetical protein
MAIIYINENIRLVDIKNKGKGYMAIKDINKDDIILIEKPEIYITMPNENPLFEIIYNVYNSKYIKEWEELVPQKMIGKIDNEMIKEIENIKNNKIKKFLQKIDKKEIMLAYAKYKQNAFNMDNKKEKIKPCILFNGAKFNHSCIPNINFYYDEKKNVMIFFANKKINKNTEICDNYININKRYDERKKILEEQYKFTCICKKCIEKI